MPVGVVQRLVRRRDAEQDEVVDTLAFLGRHDGIGIETARHVRPAAAAPVNRRHLARDRAAIALGIEGGDRPDAGLSVQHPFPAVLDPCAQRRDQTQTRNDDAAHGGAPQPQKIV